MNFPDLPDNHFGPFLAACGGLSEKLSRVIPTIQDSRKRSMLARMLEGFKQGVEAFEEQAIPEFERTHRELQASTEKTMGLLDDHKALTARMREIRDELAAKVEAAEAAKAWGQLHHSRPIHGFPAPPPNSRANLAIRAALSLVGTWYRWGGASRSGVDCSGLTMLAYNAAGIHLSHYSGAQWAETVRVPLYALRPGDLLFYGWHGDQHVAMYIGRGRMIEAQQTGTRVHVVPLRFGYGFAGAGRPRG